MIRSFRQVAMAVVALGAASGAFAAQTNVEFKTFYDTSSVFNLTHATKTVNDPVATLKLVDVDGGVAGTLVFKQTSFPAGPKGLSLNQLWLNDGGVKGTVAVGSGAPLTGGMPFYKNGVYAEGGRYNYDLKYKPGSFAAGQTSQFTIMGAGLSVSNFLTSSGAAKGLLLDVAGVGKPYNGFFGLNSNVHFIGSVVAIPEPSAFALMGLGLAGIAAVARKRKAA